MTYFKEIVTKAVVGKGKKVTTESHKIKPEFNPNTVLGCWVINNRFNGVNMGGDVYVNGSYDVNVWYSYDNDSKTSVANSTFNYSDKMNVPTTNGNKLSNNSEIIVNALSDPNVVDVRIENNEIIFDVRKEMGVEIVGDAKIRVNVEEDFDDYTVISDDEVTPDILSQIDNEINEDYLKESEIKEENNE